MIINMLIFIVLTETTEFTIEAPDIDTCREFVIEHGHVIVSIKPKMELI